MATTAVMATFWAALLPDPKWLGPGPRTSRHHTRQIACGARIRMRVSPDFFTARAVAVPSGAPDNSLRPTSTCYWGKGDR